MFVRFAKCILVAALVCVLGGHWAVLQVTAWTGMAISYAQNDSFSSAISKTFDGKHPCKLCLLVKKGKAAEKKSESKFEIKKLESSLEETFVFSFPPLPQFSSAQVFQLPSRSSLPLSPPPELV
ncbi:MAG: hypothetical protein ABJC04_03880 [Verrucomicrobiota bacterium]